MDDLTLVGVHDDGEHLVLGGAGGQRFRVRLDDALRAAVRRDRARLGQIQLESDSGLRPREIQARIRAGQTAEHIAESADVTIAHVRRYEGPVLAEREFIATQARGVRLRRSGPGGTATLALGDLVAQRLAQQGCDEHDLSWDSWRDDDGNWVVLLTFDTGGTPRRAHWTYQPQTRHVEPRDDEARRLSDDEPVEAGPLTQHRLTQIRRGAGERVYDVEADGGVRPRNGHQGDPRPGEVRSATVDLLDTLRERRGRRQQVTPPEEEAEPADPDELDSAVETLRSRAEALGNPPAAHPPRSRPEQAADADVLQLPEDEVIELPDDEELLAHRPAPRKRSTASAQQTSTTSRRTAPAPAPGGERSRHGSGGTRAPERGDGTPAARRGDSSGDPSSGDGSRTASGTTARAGRARNSTTGNRNTKAGAGARSGGDRGSGSRSTPKAAGSATSSGTTSSGTTSSGTASSGSASSGSASSGTDTTSPGSASSGTDTTSPGSGTRSSGPASPAVGPSPRADGREPGADRDPAPETGERKQRPTSARRSSRRASVPSWDDILFGSRRE